jgi:hypothetical protein
MALTLLNNITATGNGVVGTTPIGQPQNMGKSLMTTADSDTAAVMLSANGASVIDIPSGTNIIRLIAKADAVPGTKPVMDVWGCNTDGTLAEVLATVTFSTFAAFGAGVANASSGDIDTKGYPKVVCRLTTAAATTATTCALWVKAL